MWAEFHSRLKLRLEGIREHKSPSQIVLGRRGITGEGKSIDIRGVPVRGRTMIPDRDTYRRAKPRIDPHGADTATHAAEINARNFSQPTVLDIHIDIFGGMMADRSIVHRWEEGYVEWSLVADRYADSMRDRHSVVWTMDTSRAL